jgi:hypothetical protein
MYLDHCQTGKSGRLDGHGRPNGVGHAVYLRTGAWCGHGQPAVASSFRQADEVVGGVCQGEHPIDAGQAAMTGFAQPRCRFGPPEGLLDALAQRLADGEAGVPGGAWVDRRAPVGRILRDVRGQIAMVEEEAIRAALRDLIEAGSEAIMQVGTDLVITRLADEAERWLEKPILAVNSAMLWHALRAHDIQDRIIGRGSILRIH